MHTPKNNINIVSNIVFLVIFGISWINNDDQGLSRTLKHVLINNQFSNQNGRKNTEVVLIQSWSNIANSRNHKLQKTKFFYLCYTCYYMSYFRTKTRKTFYRGIPNIYWSKHFYIFSFHFQNIRWFWLSKNTIADNICKAILCFKQHTLAVF